MVLTKEVTNGMLEISTGIEQISIATTRVREIGLTNKHTIDGLLAEIGKFKL
jgi:hypothetical protein